LAISRSIVEAAGGRIWAETFPDGAVFRFVLPALAPYSAPVTKLAAAAEAR
jgi:signal transduction histidine kinase